MKYQYMLKPVDLNCSYLEACNDLNRYGKESSPRDLRITEVLNYSFRPIDVESSFMFLILPKRNWSKEYFVGELAWYLSGSDDAEDIEFYSKFWEKLKDEDGKVNSAYGYHLFTTHDMIFNSKGEMAWASQWDKVYSQLLADKDTRQAILHIKDRYHTTDFRSKDIPCTLTLQFFIRDDQLHLITNMRSSDLIYGISYDIPIFMFLQKLMALRLGIKAGTYYHNSGSLHVYENHYDMFKKIIAATPSQAGTDAWHTLCSPHLRENTPKFSDMSNENIEVAIDEFVRFWNCVRDLTSSNCERIFNEYKESENINEFWLGMGTVLYDHALKKLGITNGQ